MTTEEYLRQVEARLNGSRAARKRLLTELRDHLEDSLAAGVDAMELVGTPDDVVGAWRAHALALRAQRRRRIAVMTLTVATAGALGIAQHASGHRTPPKACSASPAPAAHDGAIGCLRGGRRP